MKKVIQINEGQDIKLVTEEFDGVEINGRLYESIDIRQRDLENNMTEAMTTIASELKEQTTLAKAVSEATIEVMNLQAKLAKFQINDLISKGYQL